MINETICAIATAHGVGGIAIVRISGDQAQAIAEKILQKDLPSPRFAQLCDLWDTNNKLIDEAIVIFFKNPHSFTGEDVVEFQCHGGFITAQRILQTSLDYGARVSNPGEFSKRAVLNNKMDLSQAEALAKLIESKSIDSAKILAKQLKGELSLFVNDLRDKLVEILAFIEVNIDYAEEDLPDDLVKQIKVKLEKIISVLKETLVTSQSREGLIDGFKIAIIGKPNVGKSSLLNALLRYERAIISDIAGTTRDTIEEEIKIGTHLVKIVDTAGIRQSDDTIEKIGIERSIAAVESADIVIALFDGSKSLDKDDQNIIDIIQQYKDNKNFIVTINKTDLEQKIDTTQLKDLNPLHISTKRSVLSLIDKLDNLLNTKTTQDDLLLISKRQVDAVAKAKDAIQRAKPLLINGELEFFAFEINEAIKFIASITHTFERDEILDKMFGSFCLGK